MAEMEMHEHYRDNTRGIAVGGLTTGIIGSALGLGVLGGNGGIRLFGNGGSQPQYVSQETFDKQNEIARLESENALLRANSNTESKIVDVYERVTTRILANERSYAEDKAAQQVINANVQSAIAVNSNNIAQLMAMTKLVIPSGNICPNPMPLYNSWTAPTTASSSAS